jgi:small conductance mechanosensitive channel
VSLRDLNGVYHVIPFSAVTTVSNFTKGYGYHVADIDVAYREDIDQAKAAMLAAYDDLKADPELGPRLIDDLEWFGVEALGESGVQLRARLKTWPGEQWTLGRAYNEAVKKRFDAAGIEIPFKQISLWFGEQKDGTATPGRFAVVQDEGAKRAAARPTTSLPTRTPARPGRGNSPTDADADNGGGAGGEDE